jgi:glycosyltransferase involved in cell wall biosynthesis
MASEFLVSVVIPAYNVQQFIKKALISVVSQPEVQEVVVVDDGSTDDTFSIVSVFAKAEPKVKLYQHPGGKNKGRGATRNLGILKSIMPYTAFLDADDFYLEGRFTKDKIILQNPKAEGVYNAVGFEFYREIQESEKHHFKPNTVTKHLQPEELFDGIVASKYGYLHLNGLTVHKTVFEKIGYFNPELVVTQDTDILLKLSLKCDLYPASIDTAVSLRGIHDNNVFDKAPVYKKYTPIMYESLVAWCFDHHLSLKKIDAILNVLWIIRFREKRTLAIYCLYWLKFLSRHPKLLKTQLAIKYFPIIRRRKQLFPYFY